MAGGVRSELLNLLGEVKARVQDKVGLADFPIPQFILVGGQSVGKSRLIEALAGETFNFISGTLGSRRPTVLEFRNVTTETSSRWFVRDRKTLQWNEHLIETVMKLVGDAHEELGEGVSSEPICVRLQSPDCFDMQVVDLPGFRDFAQDSKQELCNRIEELVKSFMRDPRNVMLCVEQCGDAATMATLSKCRELDRDFRRTILVRTKLDKYLPDLTPENVNNWVDGFGDLPGKLVRFALTLPHWPDGTPCPKNFAMLREACNQSDTERMREKQLRPQLLGTIGFKSFAVFMEKKVEHMFTDAITPVLDNLKDLKAKSGAREHSLVTEFEETDPHRILHTTRDCGTSFASALKEVMEGKINVTSGRMTLKNELRAFHEHHQKLGPDHFVMLPSEDFCGLDDYLDYLVNDSRIGAADVEVNGGAQFRRVVAEVEIFLRFSEIGEVAKKRDVIQARGVSMSSLGWRDVVVKLLKNDAHLPLQRRVQYVAERMKWFFQSQKEAVLEWMCSLEGNPSARTYPDHLWKNGKLIRQNEMMKHMVFTTYDQACARQLNQFIELFENMLTSTFANPWVFLKGATVSGYSEGSDATLSSVEDMKERIPQEMQGRSGIESSLSKWLLDIPSEDYKIDEAVYKVEQLILKTYRLIRSQICDQVELFAESFFKLPMLRLLEEDMKKITLSEQDKTKYQARRSRLVGDVKRVREDLKEVEYCIARLQDFKLSAAAERQAFGGG